MKKGWQEYSSFRIQTNKLLSSWITKSNYGAGENNHNQLKWNFSSFNIFIYSLRTETDSER